MDIFYPEQQEAHDNLVKTRGGLLFWKVGTGKTRVALEVFATLQKVYKWSYPCICLFVCKPKCFYDVRMELIKIGFDAVVLEKDYEVPETVRAQMLEKPTILLVSHAMLAKSLDYLDQNENIRMVLLDDGYLFKNPKAAKTEAAHRLTISRRAVLMSGSVMTQQDMVDIYGQAYAVNQHRRIAPNLTRFKGAYLNCVMNGKFRLYSPQKGSYQRIVDALGPAANFYFPKNQDRKIHDLIVEVPATAAQRKIFTELREWYSAEEYNLELDYALQVSQKLQQVSNGWIADEHGAPHVIENHKMDKLQSLVEDILAAGERCVVYTAFTRDIDVLAKHLPFATLQMSGRHRFDLAGWMARKADVALCTEASAVGFNHFEQVPYAIYFSMDWKWLSLQQSRGRHDRRASKHSEVFHYYLQTDGGIDADVYLAATTSENREETLIQFGAVKNWMTRT